MSGKTGSLNPSPVIAGEKDLTGKSETVNLHVNSCVVNSVLFVKGYPQKKGVNPSYCYHCQIIKCVKDVSCVDDLCSVNLVSQISHLLLQIYLHTGQIAPFFGEMGNPRDQRRLHPPFPVPAKFDQFTNCHKLLCKSPQEPLLAGGIASASDQKCSGTSSNSKIPEFLQQTIFSTQTQQLVKTYLGPEHLSKQLSKHRVV